MHVILSGKRDRQLDTLERQWETDGAVKERGRQTVEDRERKRDRHHCIGTRSIYIMHECVHYGVITHSDIGII